jgi:threonine/homoserine/homoserine lactone efflux protein
MGAVIGDLLPLAVGVAVSPIPIIAVILMLLAPRAGGTSTGFLLGWVVGIVAATALFTIIAATAGVDSSSQPAAWVGWVKIGLGALLLFLAFKQWQQRPRPGEEAALPKWMAAIVSFTFAKEAGLGFLLSALNPKNLIMCAGALSHAVQVTRPDRVSSALRAWHPITAFAIRSRAPRSATDVTPCPTVVPVDKEAPASAR